MYLSVTVEDCSLWGAATHLILCGGVLTLSDELSDRLDPGPGHQPDQEGRPAQLVRHVDQTLALPAHPLDTWHIMSPSHLTPETAQCSAVDTLTFLVTRGGGLVQNCPAPVVSVPPGGAPLDQQLHDLKVGAGGRQVQRGLVRRSGPGAIIRVFCIFALNIIL